MSLKACKECGGKVSSKATQCPHCGAKVLHWSQSRIGCGSVLLLVVLGVILIGVITSNEGGAGSGSSNTAAPESGKLSTTSDKVVGEQVLAKRKLDAKLRDPDSAEYRRVHAYQDHLKGKEFVAFCGEINVKNGFGGYTGYQRFVATMVLSVLSSEMATNKDMDQVWNRLCRPANDLGPVAF